ncbi:MAG TPA: DUF192 domain-containing protein [Candidatus Cloacimonadota bacterium]|nr:DUF192 domain-containing protein [Candidatus Cloacimonadota bacterium]HPT71313.1 DUF192 domain-containing protein [Candidatus Cloacimonadota bacterium]
MKKRIRLIVIILFCSALAFGYFHFLNRPPLEKHPENEKTMFQKQGELTFLDKKGKEISKIDIEIADTEYSREKGLMARDTMAVNQGMLFIFDYSKIQYFWMKDTILPLDMIFVDDQDKIVHIAYDAKPFSEENISSEKPALYVVEVNAGYCRDNKIEVGYKIKLNKGN